MSPEQAIALAVECGAAACKSNSQPLFLMSEKDLEAFAVLISQQAIAERSRHLPENAARLIIESYLKDMLGAIPLPCYSLEKQGEGEHEKHSWAFWIDEPEESPHENTSWVSEDGRIEWGGSTWISEKLESVAKQQESAPVLPVVAYYGKGKDGCDSVNLKENKLLREFDAGEVVAEPLCKVSDALAAIAAGGAK